MRIRRVQFTVRWMMRGIAVSAVVLALLMAAGRLFEKAFADFYKLIRLDLRASDYCDRATAWSRTKQYGKADRRIQRGHPPRARVPLCLSRPRRRLVRDEKVRQRDQRLQRRDPGSTSAVVHALNDLSDSTNASIQPFESLLADAHFSRGAAWLAKKEYDKALADFAEGVRLNPRLPTGYACRGAVWQFKGEYSKALADYGEAIGIDPGMVSAYKRTARWIWAACPDPEELRDGKKAVESATDVQVS